MVGDNASSLTDTYARGTVTIGDATAYAGGLVGGLEPSSSITRSYSSGLLVSSASTAPPSMGGLVGDNAGGAIASSYWDNQASGFPTVGVGTGTSTGASGLTTAQLKSGVMPAGFNSSNSVWTAPATVYPYFGWQGPLITISGASYLPSGTAVNALSGGAVIGNASTAIDGSYSISSPTNMAHLGPGVLTYVPSGTTNTYSNYRVAGNYLNMDLLDGAVSLINGVRGNLASLTADLSTTVGSQSGAAFLSTAPGGVLNLTSGTNLVVNNISGPFAIDQSPIGAGNIYIVSPGALTIASGQALTAGAADIISIATGSTFTNNAGANALNVSAGGRWLVYSQNSANDTHGGLLNDFKQYNATYGVTAAAQTTGNGFLYSLDPVIIPALTGSLTKVYDGTINAALTNANFSSSGAIEGDSVALSAALQTYGDKNVGSGKTVTASGLTLAASNGSLPVYGYQLSASSASGSIGGITPATLTQTFSQVGRNYNGTTSTSLIKRLLTGLQGGDAVSVDLSGAAFNFADKNVGNGKTITASGLTLTGAGSSNYVLTVAPLFGNIYQSLIGLTATADGKVYDGTTAATGNVVVSSGVFGSDQVSVASYNLVFGNKNAGVGKRVNWTATLTGNDASNYSINPEAPPATATITRAPLTQLFAADNRVYNGATSATATLGTMSGKITGDAIALSGTAAYNFADKNAAVGKTVSASGLTLSGVDANNYNLTMTQSAPANITLAPLTQNFTASNKVYDATTAASGTLGALVGEAAGDSLSFIGTPSYSFSDKNAATGKVVTAAGLSLSGVDAGNYTLAMVPTTTADITNAPLTETFTTQSKVYDGTTISTGTLGSLSGLIAGDVVAAIGTPSYSFSDKSAATGKVVSGTGLSLSGSDAGNYTLAMVPTATADITPALLTQTFTAPNKVYDGTTSSTGVLAGLSGLVAGDVVAATGTPSYSFSDKNAATGKTVSATGLSLNGADAGNYILEMVPTAAADITPALLTQTFTAPNKVYDGTTSSTGALDSLSGVITSDVVAATGTPSYSFSDKNAATGKTVSGTGLSLSGSDAGNYTLAMVPTATADITPAQLTATYMASNKVYDGTTTATATLEDLKGTLAGDIVALNGTAAYNFQDKNAATGKLVSGPGLNLTGTDAGNYTLRLTQNGTANITPAQLSYTTPADVARLYGAANPALLGTVTGLVNGETLAENTTGDAAFSSPATPASDIGRYPVIGSGLTLTNGNYVLAQAPGNANSLTVNPITIKIADVYRVSGVANPTFTVNYSGPSSDSLKAVLSSLVLVTDAPAADTPGTYRITAAIPASLANDIVVQPGTFNITSGAAINTLVSDGSPQSVATLPAALASQTLPPPAPLPSITGAGSGDDLLPGNSIGRFQVVIAPSPDWTGGGTASGLTTGSSLSQASFTEASPDGRTKKKASTYAAGARQ